MFCPECGRQLTAKDRFCPTCGAKNPDAEAPAAVPVPTDAAPDYGNQAPTNPVPDYGRQAPMNPVPGYGSPVTPEPVPDPDGQSPAAQLPGYDAAAPAQPADSYAAQPADSYAQPQTAAGYDPAFAGSCGPASYVPGKAGRAKPHRIKAERKPGGRKPLVVVLACVLAAAVLGLGVLGLINLLSPARQLERAGRKSAKQLASYLSQLPNLKKIVKNAGTLGAKQAFTADLTGELDLEGEKTEFDAKLAYNGRSKLMRLDLDPDLISAAINDAGISGFDAYKGKTASIYATSKQIQGTSRIMTGKDVYSLPTKDLGKLWNDSDLAELTDVELPDDLSVDLFDLPGTADAYLESVFGKEWTAFRKSVKTKRVKAADSIFEDAKKGTTYGMSWDEDALEDLADKAQDLIDDHKKVEQSPYGGEYYDWEYDAEFNPYTRRLCEGIVELAEAADDADEIKLQWFVQKGCLIGAGAYVEEDGNKVSFILLLTGEDNPWEEIEIEVTERYKSTSASADYGEEPETKTEWRTMTNTVTITLDVGRNDLEISGTGKYKRYDGSTNTEDLFTILYDDRSGEITGEVDGDEFGEEPVITLKPDGKNVVLSLKGPYRDQRRTQVWDDYWNEWTNEWEEVEGELELKLTIGPLTGKIEALSKKPVDLLSLDEDELKDLADEIEDKLEEYDKD